MTLYKTAFDTSATPISDIDYPQTLVPAGQSISIKTLVILFFAITSIFHVLYATDWLYTGKYSEAVNGWGWNPFRWFEYSITASIMIYVISIIVGNKDTVTALTATLITPGLMFQGYTNERELMQNALAAWGAGRGALPPVDKYIVILNFLPAWLFFVIKWYILYNAFSALKNDLQAAGKPLDPQVIAMFYTQLIGFALFGVLQSKQVADWWRAVHSKPFPIWTYATYEKLYIVLSLIVKVALGVSVALILK